MNKWRSQRLDRMGSSIFSEVSAWKNEARARGVDVIPLDIGTPASPPSEEIRSALAKAAMSPDNYSYPGTLGTQRFRESAARWFEHRFGVKLDPNREVLSLMGTQDGLSHLAMAITDPGDFALLPDPGYPVYQAGLGAAGVETVMLPLLEENGYLPDFDAVPEEAWGRIKFMLLNYPSNPLSAVADLSLFEKLVDIARRRGVLLVHDNAYSELAYGGFRPPSVLEVPGAKDVAIEFHSLSKSFHMAGARIGFAVGNPEVLKTLLQFKQNIDFGVFHAVQEAAAVALERDMAGPQQASELYEPRRDLFIRALREEGWDVPMPRATMFAWCPVPAGWSSRGFAQRLIEAEGVAVVPGNAFGERGEGYVRLAFIDSEERLLEAARRIGRFLRSGALPS
ncbi:aminotransferase class I/II-fold pyridoxal phosphate-dependent enzyme [Cohnella lubricantis]|uniref:Aminotransferase class I/II-fold pyridoxal phosphate-dependent enzyme n=1 Tax=Cohnella lubricantis TaxID=2163172 RepID=A0A841TFP8_9BACL|nr:aminotransferase class I/II-fold pyridoxal phosphate-dependent enzyme [Cohnella lubricantis]MBB6678108.1 aminotransferase class I/II-fold pyridoxal phosphate-dependent enzyme [Cohnella lubricantis]MBP2116719.1 LL-diaminopimelate aminotransferase [Cohnella lubricantis]